MIFYLEDHILIEFQPNKEKYQESQSPCELKCFCLFKVLTNKLLPLKTRNVIEVFKIRCGQIHAVVIGICFYQNINAKQIHTFSELDFTLVILKMINELPKEVFK